jgi:hypothetical protein
VQGRWAEANLVPGSSNILELLLADSTVSGTGSYTIEAGSGGTTTITGIATSSRVDLDLARSDGVVEHFRGRLVTPDTMSGSLYFTGLAFVTDPFPVTFVRLVPLTL